MPRPTNGYQNAAGQPIPGVHDVTSRYKETGGLMHWAHSQGKKGVPLYQPNVLNIGHAVHKMAELDLRGAPKREIETVPYQMLGPPEDIDKAFQAFRQFQEWRKEHCVRAIAFEEALVSEVYQYGGTPDVIALVDGDRALLDFKTSKTASDIYLEQRIAMSAHGNLWHENHPDLPLAGYHLITLPKDGSRFGHHAFADLSPEWEMFTLQLDCWRIEKGLSRKRTMKPATVAPAPKASLAATTSVPSVVSSVAKPKPAAKTRCPRKPRAKAPPAPSIIVSPPLLPPPPPRVFNTMAEMLRNYGHVKEAA